MRVSLHRRTFVSALQSIRPAVPSRELNPILMNFKLDASRLSTVAIKATDLEVAISIDMECEATAHATETAQLLLPFDRVYRMVNESVGTDFVIDERGQQIYLQCGTAKWTLPITPIEGWPELPHRTGEPTARIDVATFRTAIKRTKREVKQASGVAAARGWESGGLIMELLKDSAYFVGLNARGLSSFCAPIRGTSDVQCILPPKAAEGIMGVLEGGEASLWLSHSDLTVQCDGNVLYTRLMEGRPPPWKEMMASKTSKEVKTTVIVKAEVLSQAIGRAVIACNDEHRANFKFGKECKVWAGNGGLEGEEIIEIQHFEGEEQTLPIGHPAVLELLKCCDREEVLTIRIISPQHVVQFASNVTGWTGLVIPME